MCTCYTHLAIHLKCVTMWENSQGPVSQMLNTVNNFGKEFDVKFNPNKSQYIVFGNSKSIPMSIKFNETHLSPVESANYLGVIIGKNCSEAQIKVAKTELRRFNVLNNIFKFCSVKVKYSLFKSFCMALYGCVLWDFTSNQMSKFFICRRKCIRKLKGRKGRGD